MRTLTLATALVAALSLALVSSAAEAKTSVCKAGRYSLITGAFPGVGQLRAINLPAKTSGYAPPCLVAESVGAAIQQSVADRQKLPSTIPFVGGARWTAGRWRCSYRRVQGRDSPHEAASCHSVARPSRRVTMNLYT